MSDDLPEVINIIRRRTPARLLEGRTGAAYRTATQMELRTAHAAARDAIRIELDLNRDLGKPFVEQWGLFEVSSRALDKDEYLLRPDLGRQLLPPARSEILEKCFPQAQLQIVIGDGLSVTAVRAHVAKLLPLLVEGAGLRGWTSGQTFVVRHCRVGILNEVGDLLRPDVAVLLIGERPGLATAESLSAYMAYRPHSGDTDANRNLISNIHARGVQPEEASRRILDLAAAMLNARRSGVDIRETLGASGELSPGNR
jgi:ethanolamine ammonia-lyase small subunit